MPRLLSKWMAVGAYVSWRWPESRARSRERDLNFDMKKEEPSLWISPPSLLR